MNVTLSNGVKMPRVGLGTYRMPSEAVKTILPMALKLGYRHIDTAQAYRNEAAIGTCLSEAIAAGTVRREDLFIVTKLMPSNQGEKAYDAMLESLEKLQLDYIDLILVHWPGASGTPPESEENRVQRDKSWQAFERLYREKKVRAIGVSNYTAKHLAAMCDPASGVAIPPQCNQIEWHPSLVQEEIHAFCAKHNIVVTAYSPFGEGRLVQPVPAASHSTAADDGDDDQEKALLKQLDLDQIEAATKIAPEGMSRSQLLLAWSLQSTQGCVIPKASSERHLADNWAITETLARRASASGSVLKLLDDAVMGRLDAYVADPKHRKRFCWDPNTVA